jgi:hypothetical protein
MYSVLKSGGLSMTCHLPAVTRVSVDEGQRIGDVWNAPKFSGLPNLNTRNGSREPSTLPRSRLVCQHCSTRCTFRWSLRTTSMPLKKLSTLPSPLEVRAGSVSHYDQRFATSFFTSHCGDGPTFTAFFIRPAEARVWRHFEIPAEELHRLL